MCLQVGGHRSVFGFVCKHQRFKSNAGSYSKPAEGMQKWSNVGECGKCENVRMWGLKTSLADDSWNSERGQMAHGGRPARIEIAVVQPRDDKGPNWWPT